MILDKTHEISDFVRFEKICFDIKKKHPFIFYDICKFLISRKYFVDLAFVFNDKITNTKEAKAFCMVCENLCNDGSLKYNSMVDALARIIKNNLLTVDDCENFEHNMEGCALSQDMSKKQ